MSKKVKRKSVTLKFTIEREETAPGEYSYMLWTESEKGLATHRAVVSEWAKHNGEMPVTAFDAVRMAEHDLWAAVMGADL